MEVRLAAVIVETGVRAKTRDVYLINASVPERWLSRY
jgi:hypothetical protein